MISRLKPKAIGNTPRIAVTAVSTTGTRALAAGFKNSASCQPLAAQMVVGVDQHDVVVHPPPTTPASAMTPIPVMAMPNGAP